MVDGSLRLVMDPPGLLRLVILHAGPRVASALALATALAATVRVALDEAEDDVLVPPRGRRCTGALTVACIRPCVGLGVGAPALGRLGRLDGLGMRYLLVRHGPAGVLGHAAVEAGQAPGKVVDAAVLSRAHPVTWADLLDSGPALTLADVTVGVAPHRRHDAAAATAARGPGVLAA